MSDHLVNLPGWKTGRRIVVIESDDWGAVRMPSVSVRKELKDYGIPVENCPYNSFDSIASEDDLNALFNVLSGYRNISGQNPVITANCVVANPDFAKIKASGFREYHFELITDTFKHYQGSENSFQLWKKGLSAGLFHPQFHGREHLNVRRWLGALQQNLPETSFAFEREFYGISTNISREKRKSYMAALEFDNIEDITEQKLILSEGLNIFESLFGYRSSTFIATNYTWHSQLEQTLFDAGVNVFQGSRVQHQPEPSTGKNRLIRHYTGERNKLGQLYLVRNAAFEPSTNPGKDWVGSCFTEIKRSFLLNKPAIISSHRLNYIGAINPHNRDKNLELLGNLLVKILNKWPDVEFLTSDQLGKIILDSK